MVTSSEPSGAFRSKSAMTAGANSSSVMVLPAVTSASETPTVKTDQCFPFHATPSI